MHVAMRKSFVASYTFGAEAILQHWFWQTLKNATRSFGPLLKVFATEYDATTTCGTDAWESIFPLFPPALTLTLTLLVSVSCFVGERTRTSYTEGCLLRVGTDSKNLFIGQYNKLLEEYWLSPISYLSPYRG